MKRCLLISSGLVFLAGCTDATAPRGNPPLPSIAFDPLLPSSPHESGGELPLVERFGIRVNVVGALRPGDPLLITAQIVGKRNTRAVEVSLLVPEAQVAEKSGWVMPRRPEGIDLSPLALTSQPLAVGQVMQITTTFTVAKAGYYRAIAHATKVSDEPPFEDGVPVQEAAHDEVWFLITPEGGAVTTGFDQAAVPND